MAVPGRVAGLWHCPEREPRALCNVLLAQTPKPRVVVKNTLRLGNCRVSAATKTDASKEQLRPEVARSVPPAVLAGIILMSRENRGTWVLSVYYGHKVVTLIRLLELHCQRESHFKTDFI